eukprot:Skav200326  [mRNA]  locus=scaffold1760:181901:182614:- [translate_table: standard]
MWRLGNATARFGGWLTRSTSSSAGVLTAGAKTDLVRLGGAIAARVREDGHTTIRCIGAQAAFASIKAVVNAQGFLSHDEGVTDEHHLGIQVLSSSKSTEGSEDPRREMRMRIEPVVVSADALAVKPGETGHTDLLVGNATVPSKAAAAMAGAMRPQGGGHGKYPVVRAMGSKAAHLALVASMLAQRYLDNDDRSVRFCVLPYWSRELASEKNSKQLVFRLIPLSKKKGGATDSDLAA